MACLAKIQTTTYNLETHEEEVHFVTVGEIDENVELTPQLITEMVANMSETDRDSLARMLIKARSQELSAGMVMEHQFMSNITLDELLEEYGLRNQYTITPELYQRHILVRCSKVSLNGIEYSGRVVDSAGREIFIIRNRWDAIRYLKYLQTREAADKALSDPHNVPDSIKPYMADLDLIVRHSGDTTGRLDAVYKYLNNRDYYAPFVAEGRTITPRQVLGSVIQILTGEYTADVKHTAMEITLESLRKKADPGKGSAKNFHWEIAGEKMFETLKLYSLGNAEFQSMSYDDFAKLSQEEMTKLVLGPDGLFWGNPKLERSKLTLKTGKKSINVTTKDVDLHMSRSDKGEYVLKNDWSNVISFVESLGRKCPSWKDLRGMNPDSAVEIFNSFEYKAKVFQGDENEYVIKLRNENGSLKPYCTLTGNFVKYIPELVIDMDFPFASIGDILNVGYEEMALFSPVTTDEDSRIRTDGQYRGMYVYKGRTKKGDLEYFISRNLINRNNYLASYPSLEGALFAVDQHFESDKIIDNCLITIKQQDGKPRRVNLEATGLLPGQTLTVLNYKLPQVVFSKMPSVYQTLMNMSVKEFQETFSTVPGIETIDTPEKAAALIVELYNRVDPMTAGLITAIGTVPNLVELISGIRTLSDGTQISYRQFMAAKIRSINAASKESFYVEDVYTPNKKEVTAEWKKYPVATLRRLPADVFDVSGTIASNISTFIGQTVTDTIDFLNKKFGVTANAMTQDELVQFSKDNSLNLEDKMDSIKGFIYNGQIYINTSRASAKDLFHEVAHLLIGIAKVRHPEGYAQLVATYQRKDRYKKLYARAEADYKQFAESDWVDEAVANLIAEDINSRGQLADGFDDEWFSQTLKGIMDTMDDFKNDIPDNGLGFDGFMKTLLTDTETASAMKKDRAISYFIHQELETGRITADCKG